jgi:hypothetical protein
MSGYASQTFPPHPHRYKRNVLPDGVNRGLLLGRLRVSVP